MLGMMTGQRLSKIGTGGLTMDEHIERDAVISYIAELFTICHESMPNEYGHHFIVEKELQVFLDNIVNIPAADVVQVVRCKDCEIRQYCKVAQYLGAEGFCSNGAKMDGGET